jgi:hypothetical protein
VKTPPPNGANTKRKRASNNKVLKAIIDIMSRTAAPLTLSPTRVSQAVGLCNDELVEALVLQSYCTGHVSMITVGERINALTLNTSNTSASNVFHFISPANV